MTSVSEVSELAVFEISTTETAETFTIKKNQNQVSITTLIMIKLKQPKFQEQTKQWFDSLFVGKSLMSYFIFLTLGLMSNKYRQKKWEMKNSSILLTHNHHRFWWILINRLY